MEVTIVSRDTIKPAVASSSLHGQQESYKLSIIDQLMPTTYMPTVFFYPITDLNFNLPQTLAHLKTSLSRTLTLYYPFSGRTKNNLYIDDFDAGIPYLEARVKCSMSEFLELKELELLNRVIPLPPYRKETAHELLPLFAIQVSVFSCGGISIGVSGSHKIFDGETANNFLKSWAATFREDQDEKTLTTLLHPNFSQASSTFPARDDLPKEYVAFMESLWFQEKEYVTRRFVFDAEAIATLRDRAKSELVPFPTRVETLTCFIWKHALSASTLASTGNSQRVLSILVHAVNLRRRLNPPMADNITGNIIWFSPAVTNPSDEAETFELCDLMDLLRASLDGFDGDSLQAFCGQEGLEAFSKYFDQLLEMLKVLESPPEIYAFTSWTNIFGEIDFGWGRPFWIGVTGRVDGPAFRNFTVFVETQRGKGIEAWVTLEKKQMDIMEKDTQFLAFASPNPRIV